MKKVIVAIALIVGLVGVNFAQTAPAKQAPAKKEAKMDKKAKKEDKKADPAAKKADKKAK